MPSCGTGRCPHRGNLLWNGWPIHWRCLPYIKIQYWRNNGQHTTWKMLSTVSKMIQQQNALQEMWHLSICWSNHMIQMHSVCDLSPVSILLSSCTSTTHSPCCSLLYYAAFDLHRLCGTASSLHSRQDPCYVDAKLFNLKRAAMTFAQRDQDLIRGFEFQGPETYVKNTDFALPTAVQSTWQ